jgi:phosphoglycerol transferase MdoB-like AlkP superfamily enzyme
MILTPDSAGLNLVAVCRIYLQGFVFDLGVAILISGIYSLYLLLLPQKWNDSWVNRVITYAGFSLVLVLVLFSFFAEFTFWQEFESRFNFIAVDYLIYTYEVINNINESYPLPLLMTGMTGMAAVIFFVFIKVKIFRKSFHSRTSFIKRLQVSGAILSLAGCYLFFIKNDQAEITNNRYHNELAKAGIYSFFAAYKNNEISYEHFYKLIDEKDAFALARLGLVEENVSFNGPMNSVRRIVHPGSLATRPNVIMITIESFSAEFMAAFGNDDHITPFMDSLAATSMLFTNMYATGTRTVRGMEALSLSIPPTPGSSIVRRPLNENLFTVGTIFKKAGYDRSFVYGGDGYFDNMNQYFGSNGFDVIDRGRKIAVGDHFKNKRTIIADSLVHFENAWGICDEDLFDAVIRDADLRYNRKHPFYDFVMTTSNHRPYTYPEGKINIPPGTGRNGAVLYTDYAMRQFFSKIKSKPWYKNTVIVLVADHCASSAGNDEIDISKYHIPCMIVNLPSGNNQKINKMCSQIDLYPTLFNLLGWGYESNLFGRNVLENDYVPRIMLGTYQKLAYLRNDSLVILGPRQLSETFIYSQANNFQQPKKLPSYIINEAIAQYQSAYYLFKNGGLKE